MNNTVLTHGFIRFPLALKLSASLHCKVVYLFNATNPAYADAARWLAKL